MKQLHFFSGIKVNYFIFLNLITFLLLTSSNSILAQVPGANLIKPVPQKIINAKENFIHFKEYKIFDLLSNNSIESIFYDKVSAYNLLDIKFSNLNEIIKTNPYAISLQIPYLDTILTIQVVRHEFITNDYELKTTSFEGPIPMTMHAQHYNGMVLNDNASLVSISFFKDKIMGIISTKDFGNIVIGGINSETLPSVHIIYSDNNLLIPFQFECMSTDEDFPLAPIDDEALEVGGGGSNCVKIYFEADYDLYQDLGGISETEDYIHGFFNEVATLYENESVNVMISEILVWNNDDPFPETNSYDALYYFQDYRTSFDGDLAFLITTDPGGLGGRAFLNGLCNTNSYAYADIYTYYYDFPEYSWTVKVVTHEIGHNLSSHHTHWCGWDGGPIDNCGPLAGYDYETCGGCTCDEAPEPVDGGTIMSYCQHIDYIGINFLEGFGPQPGDAIREYIDGSFCLSECVDFVNNDEPCDAYEISVNNICTFTTSTLIGATESAVTECDYASNIDVWYTFIVPETGYVSINSDNIDIGSGDLVMGIYSVSPDCSDLIEIFCDDYSYTPGDYMPEQYNIDLTSYSCEKVYLRFAEFGTYNADSEGDFEFCIYEDVPGCGGDGIDLFPTITSLSASIVDPGNSFDVYTDTENIGDSDASSSDATIYLSTNSTFGGGDVEIGTEGTNPLNPGEIDDDIQNVTIPSGTACGDYFILFYADYPDDVISESNEGNNVAFYPIQICDNAIDLFPTITSVAADFVDPGYHVDIYTATENIGDFDAASSDATIYLSTNTTFDGDDVEIGTEGTNPLTPGEIDDDIQNVTIPPGTSCGDYYILFYADYPDDVISESNEGNNVAYYPIQICSDGLANIFACAHDLSPIPVASGETLTFQSQTTNYGDATSTPMHNRFYISNDETWSVDDIYLGEEYVGTIPPGDYNISTQEFGVPAYIIAGTYYLFVYGDYYNELEEYDEINFCHEVLYIVAPPTIDIGVAEISTPLSGCGLTTENISATIENYGTSTVTSFPIKYQVNGGTIHTETAFLTIFPATAGYYTFTLGYNFSTPGDYLVDVWTALDGDVLPGNDHHTITINSYATPSVELGPSLNVCDNVVLDAGNPGSTYLWNTGATTQTLNVTTTGTYSVTVTNPTTGCTDYDNIYVTVNHTPIAGFTYSAVGLSVNFTNTSTYATSYLWNFGDGGTSTLTNPPHTYLADGDYTVQLTATNICGSDIYNLLISVDDGIINLPDIVGNIISVTPTVVHPGDLITITYTMSNIGGADVVGSYINRFKLSLDCILLDDIFVRTDNHSDLPAMGDVMTFTVIDTIPIATPFDTYNLIIALDASEDIDEITDDNNNPCYVSIIVEDTCNIYLSSPGITFNNLGGSGSFSIDTYNGCNWNIESVPSWVTILTPYFGDGPSTVVYNVMENLTCDDRIGDIFVNGELFEITQTGIEESYTLSDYDVSFSSIGGDGSVFVSATTEFCEWDIINPAEDWVTIILGPYSGSNTVYYSVASNIGGGPRSTTLTVAGQPFNIEQDEGLIVENATDIHFNIYPNPANNELIIEIPDQLQNLTVDIINIIGQLVQSHEQMANSNKIIFNVENIASGLYFIEINYNEGKYKLPVVIQH